MRQGNLFSQSSEFETYLILKKDPNILTFIPASFLDFYKSLRYKEQLCEIYARNLEEAQNEFYIYKKEFEANLNML